MFIAIKERQTRMGEYVYDQVHSNHISGTCMISVLHLVYIFVTYLLTVVTAVFV